MAWHRNRRDDKPGKDREKQNAKINESRREEAAILAERIREAEAPWQKNWTPAECCAPYNPVSKKEYRGYNRLILAMPGYNDPRWLSQKQLTARGWRVREGESPRGIEFWQYGSSRPATDAKGNQLKYNDEPLVVSVKFSMTLYRRYAVFNATQLELLDGGPVPSLEPRVVPWSGMEALDRLVRATGAMIRHDQADRCYYDINTDSIGMPDPSAFKSSGAYYASLLHELAHWTRRPGRLDRPKDQSRESEAREELVAEISAWMLCQDMGLDYEPENHYSYCHGWAEDLAHDPGAVASATSQAEKVRGYLLALAPGLKLPAPREPKSARPAERPTEVSAPEPAPAAPRPADTASAPKVREPAAPEPAAPRPVGPGTYARDLREPRVVMEERREDHRGMARRGEIEDFGDIYSPESLWRVRQSGQERASMPPEPNPFPPESRALTESFHPGDHAPPAPPEPEPEGEFLPPEDRMALAGHPVFRDPESDEESGRASLTSGPAPRNPPGTPAGEGPAPRAAPSAGAVSDESGQIDGLAVWNNDRDKTDRRVRDWTGLRPSEFRRERAAPGSREPEKTDGDRPVPKVSLDPVVLKIPPKPVLPSYPPRPEAWEEMEKTVRENTARAGERAAGRELVSPGTIIVPIGADLKTSGGEGADKQAGAVFKTSGDEGTDKQAGAVKPRRKTGTRTKKTAPDKTSEAGPAPGDAASVVGDGLSAGDGVPGAPARPEPPTPPPPLPGLEAPEGPRLPPGGEPGERRLPPGHPGSPGRMLPGLAGARMSASLLSLFDRDADGHHVPAPRAHADSRRPPRDVFAETRAMDAIVDEVMGAVTGPLPTAGQAPATDNSRPPGQPQPQAREQPQTQALEQPRARTLEQPRARTLEQPRARPLEQPRARPRVQDPDPETGAPDPNSKTKAAAGGRGGDKKKDDSLIGGVMRQVGKIFSAAARGIDDDRVHWAKGGRYNPDFFAVRDYSLEVCQAKAEKIPELDAEYRLQLVNHVLSHLCRPGLALSGIGRWKDVLDLADSADRVAWSVDKPFKKFLEETERVARHQMRTCREIYSNERRIDWDRREVSVCNSLLLLIDASRKLDYRGILFPRCPGGRPNFRLVPITVVREADVEPRHMRVDGHELRTHRVCDEGDTPAGHCVVPGGGRDVALIVRDRRNAEELVASLNSAETSFLTRYRDEEREDQLDGATDIPEPERARRLTAREHLEIQERIDLRAAQRSEGCILGPLFQDHENCVLGSDKPLWSPPKVEYEPGPGPTMMTRMLGREDRRT
ncbi:MAG: ssDNA-binding domain-containing protein, partial [Deltaproteobacteria bacterium]|nr:ssDNA-binding domain-containing protein [Deltaproteobacteria bacterium]